ncbi:hypothetical protein A3J90_07430 [candidate division WOR-1 bacterium RIFOXYC2_FULL_37_10]|uniref:Orc1-like AAA ATPase domain-containing protein n=1 Tax=candidate division WOR-1 bacterium RIFOXYB2_FULL_37_13 TaxID=1802579 RepID=A0A1F4SQL1_UNCSA|nr:MAG: hypothetical protein A2310_07735 [candidate division WOR-1 bacterium RIFOXYB2_FULL_37_13]OGC36283.1 MAG: hypothetical protein A3J90_07430 [candidate division WOR-1 bacterium RIFOXYC2_FULL_37_10]
MNLKSNPFTPKSGMEPRIFVGREEEIKFFKKQLEKAKQNYYDHFLVRGDWGIGKTSLLKEYKKIAQSQKIHSSFVTIREFQEGDKFIQATQHLITQIPRHLPVKHEKLKNLLELTSGLGLTLPLIGGGIQFAEKAELRGDPQVLLLDALVRLWKDIKNKTDVVLVLLDDIQNYKPISGYLNILRNVLSDEEIVKETGFLFILASTFEGWEIFLKKHHPIGRYFSPSIKLAKLKGFEVHESIDETLKNTGVKFENSIKNKIFDYTGGHPLESQILCSYLYDNQIEGIVGEDVWDVSLDNTLGYLGEILLNSLIVEASDREREILLVLAREFKPLGWKEIADEILRVNKKFPKEAVGTILARLVSKQLLTQEKRGIYLLPDRMFREYLLRNLHT